MAIKQIVKKVGEKVVDVASDVLSAPARIKANAQIKQSDRVYKDAKMVNDFKGKPDSGDYTDPLFRARINNLHDKADAQEKAAKLEVAKKVNAKPSNYETDYAKMRGGVPLRNDMQANGGKGYDKLNKKK